MIVIQSGFRRVGDVLLAPNVVAVRNGIQPFTADTTARLLDGRPFGLCDRITWDVELWSLPPEDPPQRYTHAAYNPFGFNFDPHTGWLLFGEPDGDPGRPVGVKRADGTVVFAPEPDAGITGFALSPDGERMLCLESWRDMSVFDTPPPERRFVLCTRTTDGGWVRQQVVRRSDEFLECPAFLPDGQRFIATWHELRSNSRGTQQYPIPVQRVFDATTFDFLETVEDWQSGRAPDFCGHWMVTFHSTDVRFYDTRDFSCWVSVKSGRRKFAALATDPTGQFFLTASGHRVSVWETKTWSEVKTFAWKAGPITCLAVAPDGLTAAAGTATGKVVVWDVE